MGQHVKPRMNAKQLSRLDDSQRWENDVLKRSELGEGIHQLQSDAVDMPGKNNNCCIDDDELISHVVMIMNARELKFGYCKQYSDQIRSHLQTVQHM